MTSPTRPWLLPGLFAAYLTSVAVLTASTAYAPRHFAILALLYGLFAIAVVAGGRLIGRVLGSVGAMAACFLIALAAVYHLREQTRIPESLTVVVVAAAILAPFLRPLLPGGQTESRGWRHALLTTLLAGLAFAGSFTIVFGSSAVMRWHLLRHNTMLGTPAYYLLSTPVERLRNELFAAHGIDLVAGSHSPKEQTGAPPLAASAGPREAKAPNIVFVVLDTLRADALTAWGGEPGQMPKLERRLETSWRFTDVWANASWTRPSMASYFTGLQPEEHGARMPDEALGQEQSTLAEALRERGYETVAFVSNVAAVGRGAGFDQGFDLFRELPQTPYARAGAVRRSVEEWLSTDAIDLSSSLFLYLHFLDPHEPYLAGDAPKAEQAADYRRAYGRELAYLDGELDVLLDRLEETLVGPTVFVLVSDHGEEFFEHGLFGHGFSLYQEVIHVPVALWRTGGQGQPTPARLEARDFFDLLLGIADDPSLSVSAWAATSARTRRYSSIYYSTSGRLLLRPYLRTIAMRALQVGDEKVIWSGYGDTLERYDLGADPGEERNLSASDMARSDALGDTFDRETPRWSPGGELELSPEAVEQLRALGYIG